MYACLTVERTPRKKTAYYHRSDEITLKSSSFTHRYFKCFVNKKTLPNLTGIKHLNCMEAVCKQDEREEEENWCINRKKKTEEKEEKEKNRGRTRKREKNKK